jgi:3-hydroxyisobutyrate dehydrogenase-like beta-hydroxyacid dehydrogenase
MDIGYIGLGTMGAPMARHLVEDGHDLLAFDIRQQAVDRLVGAGANQADSVETIGDTTDIVFLSLPGPAEVVEVIDRLTTTLDSGDVIVDTTTSDPEITERLALAVAEADATYLAAPVSGGETGAREGTLTTIGAGDPAVFDAANPLLEAYSSVIYHVGDSPAQGHIAKLLNNYLSISAFICTCEALALADHLGLSRETVLDIINTSSGRNSATVEKFPDHVLDRSFDSGTPITLMRKDIGLIASIGDDEELPLFVGTMMAQLVRFAESWVGSDADYTRIYEFFEAGMADQGGLEP